MTFKTRMKKLVTNAPAWMGKAIVMAEIALVTATPVAMGACSTMTGFSLDVKLNNILKNIIPGSDTVGFEISLRAQMEPSKYADAEADLEKAKEKVSDPRVRKEIDLALEAIKKWKDNKEAGIETASRPILNGEEQKELFKALGGNDPHAKAKALYKFGKAGIVLPNDAYFKALAMTEDPIVRFVAAWAIGEVYSQGGVGGLNLGYAVGQLKEAFNEETRPRNGEAIREALGKLK